MLRDEQGNYAGQGTARRTYYMLHTAGSHFEALKALGKVEPIDGWAVQEVRGLGWRGSLVPVMGSDYFAPRLAVQRGLVLASKEGERGDRFVFCHQINTVVSRKRRL